MIYNNTCHITCCPCQVTHNTCHMIFGAFKIACSTCHVIRATCRIICNTCVDDDLKSSSHDLRYSSVCCIILVTWLVALVRWLIISATWFVSLVIWFMTSVLWCMTSIIWFMTYVIWFVTLVLMMTWKAYHMRITFDTYVMCMICNSCHMTSCPCQITHNTCHVIFGIFHVSRSLSVEA